MTTIGVRAATAADEPAVAPIFRSASLSNDGDREVLLAHPEALVLPDGLLDRGRTRVATSPDGTVVGFAGTRPTERGVLELDDLFVDPRARRAGAARAHPPDRGRGRGRGRGPDRGHGEPARSRLL